MKVDQIVGLIIVALFMMVLGVATVSIIDAVYHHYQEQHTQEEKNTWNPPRIPSCEKELWDRIRGECDAISE